MLSTSLDVTTSFNANNGVKLDVGQWQNVVIHVSGSVSGTVDVTGTNDGGAVEGSTGNNPIASLHYTAIQVVDMSSGTAVTSISAAGNFKISNPTQYIQIGGASAATDGKVIIFLTTPV